jgi:hypothetical protein
LPHRKGPDGIFNQYVADIEPSILAVAHQGFPLVEGVLDGFVGQAVFGYFCAVLLQPQFQIIKYRQAEFLALCLFLFGFEILDMCFYAVELADLAYGNIGLAGLNKLPSGVIPAADAFDRIVQIMGPAEAFLALA